MNLKGIWIADPSLSYNVVQQDIPALRFAQVSFESSICSRLIIYFHPPKIRPTKIYSRSTVPSLRNCNRSPIHAGTLTTSTNSLHIRPRVNSHFRQARMGHSIRSQAVACTALYNAQLACESNFGYIFVQTDVVFVLG